MDKFLELLDERADVEGRERGLITVSNHVSVYVRLPVDALATRRGC
jgi:monolysocardiolipin acyltransferase